MHKHMLSQKQTQPREMLFSQQHRTQRRRICIT
jgi:hypothetical protein